MKAILQIHIIRKEEGLDYIFDDERPRIMGWDVSGIIAAVGEDVDKFKVGDEVLRGKLDL